MLHSNLRYPVGLVVCCLVLALATALAAQGPDPGSLPPTDPATPDDPSATTPAEDPILSDAQGRLADKYRRLEDLLFKMADFEATCNPRRAALLKQAYKQSKDRLTHSQLMTIATLLKDQKYSRAIDGQQIAHKDLNDLLQLLMSEDRSDRLKDETQKIKEYIKQTQTARTYSAQRARPDRRGQRPSRPGR